MGLEIKKMTLNIYAHKPWPSGHLLLKKGKQMAKTHDQVVNHGHLHIDIIINNLYIADGQMAMVLVCSCIFKKEQMVMFYEFWPPGQRALAICSLNYLKEEKNEK